MGEPRESRLSHDEQRTLFTLWEIARSPLMLGANLTMRDPFTRSLVTNSASTESCAFKSPSISKYKKQNTEE